MHRALSALFATGLLALGLVACAAAPGESRETTAPVPPVVENSGPEAGAAADAADAGAALCATGVETDADVCVIEQQAAEADVVFDAYRVVKLIDASFPGTVTISGAEQVVIEGTTVDGDLMLTQNDGVVLTDSDISRNATVSGGEHATIVSNDVAGDLTCDGARVDGRGNSVAGANACAGLR